jgi:hypothetical protein
MPLRCRVQAICGGLSALINAVENGWLCERDEPADIALERLEFPLDAAQQVEWSRERLELKDVFAEREPPLPGVPCKTVGDLFLTRGRIESRHQAVAEHNQPA